MGGASFYVDYTSGSDSNNGSVLSPFKTIQAAVDAGERARQSSPQLDESIKRRHVLQLQRSIADRINPHHSLISEDICIE